MASNDLIIRLSVTAGRETRSQSRSGTTGHSLTASPLGVPALLAGSDKFGGRISGLGQIGQKLFKALEQADVIKKRRACLEVHKEIQIAVGASLAPGDRAEYCDAMCSVFPRDTEDLRAAAAQAVPGQYDVG
jgi:hypothetical protein